MNYVASDQNKERASWARAALERFQEITGSDTGDALSDLLADLMHLSEQRPADATDEEHYEDFDSALDRAHRHISNEYNGED